MSHVSHKLSNAFEGALAGGGDPATSPLYVFGPFLRLLAVAGLGSLTFGASIWLAVLTVVTVSAMYRRVMIWVTDGTGGSGLNEEEFGPWAVKVNAGITVVEYTLTFLVSIAAMVTFVADRFTFLSGNLGGIPFRTALAVLLTLLTGFLVNRGPRVAARAFGPATLAVLILLWAMIGAAIWKLGFHLPDLDLRAFDPRHLHITLGGYARILALMTGIEIFANLVAAYQGTARERSRKAFGSLLIIMGTTSVTMLIVGPAILAYANPLDPQVSVFTQTMDHLLPGPLAYAGTLVGIAVLLSAAAASAQGIQNLSLGLRYRHYTPAWLGQRNRFGVAHRPVWLQAGLCVFCYFVFGTLEETYLALYAAGVFILLSLTGWAAVKRLLRGLRIQPTLKEGWALAGTLLAALLTTGATLIIFDERFKEGAWTYLVFIPLLYGVFSYFRATLGEPRAVEDRLGMQLSSSYLPPGTSESMYAGVSFRGILVPLDQSPAAEQSLPIAETMSRAFDGRITLLTVLNGAPQGGENQPTHLTDEPDAKAYLGQVAGQLEAGGCATTWEIDHGPVAARIAALSQDRDIDLIVLSTHGRSRLRRWLISSITTDVIYETTPPLLILRPTADWRSTRTRFAHLLVALDGSEIAEQVLPYAHSLAERFQSKVTLLSVKEGPESEAFPDVIAEHMNRIAAGLAAKNIVAEVQVLEGDPATTIPRVGAEAGADLLLLVSHGRGGVARQNHVKLGSVADAVLQQAPCPVFLVSALPPTEEKIQSRGEKRRGGGQRRKAGGIE